MKKKSMRKNKPTGIYAHYRLNGAHTNPDTPWGPEDDTNDFQHPDRHAGANGTVAAHLGTAIDEDMAGWDSCAGSLGPDVFTHQRGTDFVDPADSPTDPAHEE